MLGNELIALKSMAAELPNDYMSSTRSEFAGTAGSGQGSSGMVFFSMLYSVMHRTQRNKGFGCDFTIW
jgi:hypothetical protein